MSTHENNNLDNIIKKTFGNEIQQKRVKKEITSLKDLNQKFFRISLISANIGLKIIVEITKELLDNIFEEDILKPMNSIIFELLLEPKFPFTFPKMFCRTKFIDPSLADGRDYTNEIIGKMWTPSILLSQIVGHLPDFIHKVYKTNDKLSLQKMGTYYLGHIYDLEDYLLLESVACFPAKELTTIKLANPNRYVVITETNFLNFELEDKKRNIIKLISWAHLQSLLNIKRKKDDASSVIFTWRDKNRSEGTSQTFLIEDANKCIEIIIQNMKKFGVKITKNVVKQPDLKLEDVTTKKYEQININILVDNIALLESRLADELTLDNVNTLMTLYQKAIEYFSALGDPLFEVYLDRLHYFLLREDIQVVLKSKEETLHPKDPRKKPNQEQVKINSEDDDEEEKKGPDPFINNSKNKNNDNYISTYKSVRPVNEVKSSPIFENLGKDKSSIKGESESEANLSKTTAKESQLIDSNEPSELINHKEASPFIKDESLGNDSKDGLINQLTKQKDLIFTIDDNENERDLDIIENDSNKMNNAVENIGSKELEENTKSKIGENTESKSGQDTGSKIEESSSGNQIKEKSNE